ncbi:MAG TPA: autotransporter-associated beta strand repeat-containing protein [Pirellulales bacterium]
MRIGVHQAGMRLSSIAIVLLRVTFAHAQLRSFPEAEGVGAVATGARNAASPTVYHVTNLNDSGAGSFRDAVSGSNRIVVFDVGGYIHLTTPVSAKSNLTLLGQTAPGDGVGIYGAEVSFFDQSNDIVRYVRFRDTTLDPGYKGTSSPSSSSSNAINIGSSSNMIFDHISAEFAAYNNIDAATAPNLTFQNSLVAAPLASQRFNFHWEGGGTAGNWGDGTFVNNVFVDGHNRSILAKGDTQFVNNTIYNYQAAFTSGKSSGSFRYDVMSNYFIAGPSTTSAGDDFYQVDSTQSAYATGNLLDSNKDSVLNGSADNSVDSATVLGSAWSANTAQLPQLSTAASYSWNIAHAGDSLKHDVMTYAPSNGYDAVDAQMMTNVQSLGTGGRLWSSETQTGLANGGLGTLNTGAKPTDTDNDGIPDAWEAVHGMNPNSASDALMLNPIGYRMIEQYANELTEQSDIRAWTATSGTWNQVANWTGGLPPNAFENVQIRGNGAANGNATVASGTATGMELSIGGNGPAAGESVTVSGGVLNIYDTIRVGDQNNAALQINGGTVKVYNIILGSSVFAPSATNYTGTINFSSGLLSLSQLVLGGGTSGNWTTGGSLNWSGGTLQAVAQLNVNVPITISSIGGTIDTNGFDGTISGSITGTGGITKKGTGTLTLAGANSYSGDTTVSAGTLMITADNPFQFGVGKGLLNVSGGTFEMNGNSVSINGLSGSGGTVNQKGPESKTLTVGYGDTTARFFGVISNIGSGTLNLTKIGNGVQYLGGVDTYTGITTINQGTLAASPGSIPSMSNMVLGGGTFSTALAGYNGSIGTLSVTANSHIDLGSMASIVHFASSSALTWNGTLTIDNWSGSLNGGAADQIFVGNSAAALTPTQLASIVFTGSGMLDATQLATGEIVPGRTFVAGDFNRDRQLSPADLQSMLVALSDTSTYEMTNNLTNADLLALGDFNHDGQLNNLDLQGMISALANALSGIGNGSASAVPEPTALVLLAIAFPLLISLGQRRRYLTCS